ncbi:FHA domain-containing protein [Paenibacillus cisolokensis]|uniref:FHA domain-containing protein n=1 Tax=Paenibacillus cisolokensis TaxID=1658519 RepID=UPI003D267F13
MDRSSFLMVERGNPYEHGDVILLTRPVTVLGRRGTQGAPDVSFDNIYVSRRHAAIIYRDGGFFIQDLESKHGTFVNQRRLAPGEEVPLASGDSLALARDLVALRFSVLSTDETMDMTPFMKQLALTESGAIRLDPYKQELIFRGETYAFSEKEFKCVELLFHHKGQFVSKEQVKLSVWPERSYGEDEIPDVSTEELNALIYRVRKKTKDLFQIESIRGRGYILDVEEEQ